MHSLSTCLESSHTSSCVTGSIGSGLDDPLGPRPVAKVSRHDLEASLKWELANFSIKDQIGNISIFLGHMVSVTTTQLCCNSGGKGDIHE